MVLQIKEATKQFPCALGDYDRVRLSKCLQTRRKVGSLADDYVLLSRTTPNQIANDHQPGRNANTGLERIGCVQFTDCCDQLQSRPHTPARRRPHVPADSRNR